MEMKSLLLALALLSSSVSAQEIFATADNSAGGQIVLLAMKSDCPKNHRAMFATLPTGETSFGCWAMVFDFIRVKYHDGSTRMYALGPDYWDVDPFYTNKISKAKINN
jgi:hypothetical protein